MGTTSFGVGHPMAVKLWARKLYVEVLKQTTMAPFIGEGTDSLITIKPETAKGPGDKVTYGLRMQLTGDGIIGDGTLEGNEEALTIYSDALYINQLRNAVESDGKMSEQRVPFNVREEIMSGLRDWYANRLDTSILNQLCGNTAVTDLSYTGLNSAIAPDSQHILYAPGTSSNSSEASVAGQSTAVFTLNLIDKCVEKARTLTPGIRPLRIKGDDKYVIFLHPYQVYDLRTSTSSGQWLDIQKAAMTGGQVTNNPIYTGALGEYNGVIIHQNVRVASVVDNVRRAVFCGAQAATIAYGQKSSKVTWVEKLFDYGNKLGVAAGMIWGCKKSVFNSADFATIVCATYAVAHTA